MDDGEANAEATKAYIAALNDGLCTIDEVTAFVNSPAAKDAFGEKLGEMQAHAQQLKDSGAQFCDCDACKLIQEILAQKEYLNKKSVWIFGGDGWAYDIGFGGLDHVLASGKNINILVLDTEVYSNTGGQASKATPTGSTARFVTGGKQTRKKDLASMAMTYGNVYVAQIAMGADFNQTLRAFKEAAAYPGPALVIAYATCIAHGIRAGLGSTPHEAKKAVDAGYYHLFRFNPAMQEQGKNPFTLDSGEPSLDYEEFLNGEIRYDALRRYHPNQAQALFQKAQAQAKERYRYLKRLEALYAPD